MSAKRFSELRDDLYERSPASRQRAADKSEAALLASASTISRRTRLRYWWRRTWPKLVCPLIGHRWELDPGLTPPRDWCERCDSEREAS